MLIANPGQCDEADLLRTDQVPTDMPSREITEDSLALIREAEVHGRPSVEPTNLSGTQLEHIDNLTTKMHPAHYHRKSISAMKEEIMTYTTRAHRGSTDGHCCQRPLRNIVGKRIARQAETASQERPNGSNVKFRTHRALLVPDRHRELVTSIESQAHNRQCIVLRIKPVEATFSRIAESQLVFHKSMDKKTLRVLAVRIETTTSAEIPNTVTVEISRPDFAWNRRDVHRHLALDHQLLIRSRAELHNRHSLDNRKRPKKAILCPTDHPSMKTLNL
jgi:hypothetical protein